jgi:hypothetical protein
MATQMFTKAQVYSSSAIALVISTVALIFGILVIIETFASGIPTLITTSFKNVHGFQGAIKKNQLTLSTKASGLLTYQSGELTSAVPPEITSRKLQGFSNVAPGSNIIASDSIMNALEKCVVLKATPLTGLTHVFAEINENDTLFDGLQKLAGSYNILANPFCMYEPISINNNIPTQIWTTTNIKGSLIFAAYSFRSGTNVTIRNFGTLVTAASAGTDTTTLQFDFAGASIIHVTNILSNGTVDIVMEINMFSEFNTISLLSTLFLYNIPGDTTGKTVVNTMSIDRFEFNPAIPNAVELLGSTSAPTTTLNMKNSIATLTSSPLPL